MASEGFKRREQQRQFTEAARRELHFENVRREFGNFTDLFQTEFDEIDQAANAIQAGHMAAGQAAATNIQQDLINAGLGNTGLGGVIGGGARAGSGLAGILRATQFRNTLRGRMMMSLLQETTGLVKSRAGVYSASAANIPGGEGGGKGWMDYLMGAVYTGGQLLEAYNNTQNTDDGEDDSGFGDDGGYEWDPMGSDG